METAPQTRHAFKLELAADVLREFSEVRFVAQGTSMLPAIYPGDCLTIRSFGAGAPRCGDIVLCHRSGEFRVHRILSILEKGPAKFYVLRGDALTHDDPPIPASELLGRVTYIARRGKSCEINSIQRMPGRFLRAIVHRSKIAVVLLLRWHAMRTRAFLHSESLPEGSAQAETECT